jgi:hypothetical protein
VACRLGCRAQAFMASAGRPATGPFKRRPQRSRSHHSLHRHSHHSPAMGFWKKGSHDHEASGSRHQRPPPRRRSPPRRARTASPQPPRQRDHRYIPVTHCQALYHCGQSVDWPDCSLPSGWHLNSRRMPVPPVPRYGPDWVTEIRRRRGLMPAPPRRSRLWLR